MYVNFTLVVIGKLISLKVLVNNYIKV